jgi:DNA polymerase-3 subunit gamma/tau
VVTPKITTSISSELKTPSIKLGLKKEETKVEEVKDKSGEQAKEKFTKEQLRYQLNEFLKRYKSHEIEFIVLSREARLDENTFQVSLELDNSVQEDALNRMRQELLDHLRTNLRNFSVQINATVIESTASKRPYTINEKLQYLVEQNPMIGEFKKRFGLDTDY